MFDLQVLVCWKNTSGVCHQDPSNHPKIEKQLKCLQLKCGGETLFVVPRKFSCNIGKIPCSALLSTKFRTKSAKLHPCPDASFYFAAVKLIEFEQQKLSISQLFFLFASKWKNGMYCEILADTAAFCCPGKINPQRRYFRRSSGKYAQFFK